MAGNGTGDGSLDVLITLAPGSESENLTPAEEATIIEDTLGAIFGVPASDIVLGPAPEAGRPPAPVQPL